MENLIAQIKLFPEGGFRGIGPLGLEGQAAERSVPIFNQVLSTIIGVMTVVAFVWFTFQFILAAIGILTSGGDKGKLETARNKITTSIIGLVLVIAAIFIIELIGNLIGVSILRGAFWTYLLGGIPQ